MSERVSTQIDMASLGRHSLAVVRKPRECEKRTHGHTPTYMFTHTHTHTHTHTSVSSTQFSHLNNPLFSAAPARTHTGHGIHVQRVPVTAAQDVFPTRVRKRHRDCRVRHVQEQAPHRRQPRLVSDDSRMCRSVHAQCHINLAWSDTHSILFSNSKREGFSISVFT